MAIDSCFYVGNASEKSLVSCLHTVFLMLNHVHWQLWLSLLAKAACQ